MKITARPTTQNNGNSNTSKALTLAAAATTTRSTITTTFFQTSPYSNVIDVSKNQANLEYQEGKRSEPTSSGSSSAKDGSEAFQDANTSANLGGAPSLGGAVPRQSGGMIQRAWQRQLQRLNKIIPHMMAI